MDIKKYDIRQCPFCGGDSYIFTNPNNCNNGSMNTYSIYCIKCLVSTPEYGSIKEVVEAWNRRMESDGSTSNS